MSKLYVNVVKCCMQSCMQGLNLRSFLSDTTFVGFRNVCSSETNYMFITIPNNEDLQHPINVQSITKSNSTEGALLFIHHPNLG